MSSSSSQGLPKGEKSGTRSFPSQTCACRGCRGTLISRPRIGAERPAFFRLSLPLNKKIDRQKSISFFEECRSLRYRLRNNAYRRVVLPGSILSGTSPNRNTLFLRSLKQNGFLDYPSSKWITGGPEFRQFDSRSCTGGTGFGTTSQMP